MHNSLSLLFLLLFSLFEGIFCVTLWSYLRHPTENNEISEVLDSGLPLPVFGECKEKEWQIDNFDQFYKLVDQLECIWSAALTPAAVPLGYLYGRLLTFANTKILNPFTRFFYQGDYTFETQCNGIRHVVGHVKMANFPVSYGIWTIGVLPLRIADGEFYDSKPSIIMDFTVDLKSLCVGEGVEKTERNTFSLYSLRPFQTSGWPTRLFVDLLRVAGCDKTDGGIFLLGRTFMLDPQKSLNRPVFTVLFFVLKTFDLRVLPPDVSCATLALKQETPFNYTRHGAGDFLSRLEPTRYIRAFLEDDLPNGLFNYTTPAQH